MIIDIRELAELLGIDLKPISRPDRKDSGENEPSK
jgi:hypothetical protein